MKRTKRDGFTSVFIVIILSALMAALTIVITASLDRAADSISDVVTANAGSSVLTECNKNLHDSYGILAIKNDPIHLSNLADYYITESISGLNRFVHLSLTAAIIEIPYSSDMYVSDFRKQVASLGQKNLIFKKDKTIGLMSFVGYDLPSKAHCTSYLAFSPANLISKLDIIQNVGQGFFITEYVMNNFTDTEIEYLLFGGSTASENEQSLHNMIFAVKCVANCVAEIEDPVLWLEAIIRASEETEQIMADPIERGRYLRAGISAMAYSSKLMYRMMDIMQLSVGNGFFFKDYAYSFTIHAQYKRGHKIGIVSQKHKYTY